MLGSEAGIVVKWRFKTLVGRPAYIAVTARKCGPSLTAPVSASLTKLARVQMQNVALMPRVATEQERSENLAMNRVVQEPVEKRRIVLQNITIRV